MAIIRLSICKTDKEWSIIEDIIKQKSNGKKLTPNGKGFAQYIASEINKNFSGEERDTLVGSKIQHSRKCFIIKVSDDVCNEIKNKSGDLGITPAVLLARIILDPHLLGK